jgi:acyl-CoA reductase-like NAD-dependent aldehyde dehydrogenase
VSGFAADVDLRTQLHIAGQFVDALDGSTFTVENPAQACLAAEVAEAKPADVDRAVQEADELARIETRQNGKPLFESRQVDLPEAPFGGYKQSGFGRDLGMHALEGYTQVKNVWIDLG